MTNSRDNWRISFEFYAVVEQTHVDDDWLVNCAELFHLSYRPRGSGPWEEHISKWCIKGKNLLMSTVPEQGFGVFEPANQIDWQLRKWTKVELLMEYDTDGYYFSFLVDDEVVTREKHTPLNGRPEPSLRNVTLHSGCVNYNRVSVSSFWDAEGDKSETEYYRKWGKCEAVDVYIANVQMETWYSDSYLNSLTPETIGTGGCREEYFPLLDKCIKIFPNIVAWDEANSLCESDNSKLLRKD